MSAAQRPARSQAAVPFAPSIGGAFSFGGLFSYINQAKAAQAAEAAADTAQAAAPTAIADHAPKRRCSLKKEDPSHDDGDYPLKDLLRPPAKAGLVASGTGPRPEQYLQKKVKKKEQAAAKAKKDERKETP